MTPANVRLFLETLFVVLTFFWALSITFGRILEAVIKFTAWKENMGKIYIPAIVYFQLGFLWSLFLLAIIVLNYWR
jgi:hypothetical protein